MESRKIYGGGGVKSRPQVPMNWTPSLQKSYIIGMLLYWHAAFRFGPQDTKTPRFLWLLSGFYDLTLAGKSEDSRTLLSKTLIKLIYFVVPVPLEHEFSGLACLKNNFFSLSLTAVDLFVDQTWSDSTFGVKVGGGGGFNFSNPNNYGKFWSKPN